MIAGIIAARMSSSRLPGKVLLKICGKTALELMIERVKRSKTIDKIIIATSTNKQDDFIEKICKEIEIECIRGPEEDLLSRYKIVSDKIKPCIIVKMGADSILIDPLVIDHVVNTFLNGDYDYVSNYGIPKTYPEGCTVDVYTSDTLNEVFQEAKKPSEREHISPFMWNKPEKYRFFRVDYKKDLSNYRLSLDYYEDFLVIKSIFESLYPKNPNFTLEDVIAWLDSNPGIAKLNSHISPSEGILKSFEEDKQAGF
jgi:spore coat polysaccharide biosynthesis protein SpsF|tara:strand:- start:1005 stop:1769 length:765 start_codon:yes stop_codon:yes gene_type:complete